MNRRLVTVLFSCFIASLVIYESCIKDKCGIVVCNNGGVCVDGTCTCPTGYEGVSCSKMWNEKFSGRWNVRDSFFKTRKPALVYDISVAGNGLRDSFYITGFSDPLSVLVLCKKAAYRTFAFAEQKLDSFITIKSGTGMLDSASGTITGNYSYLRKIMQPDATTKDTTVTVYFSWKR